MYKNYSDILRYLFMTDIIFLHYLNHVCCNLINKNFPALIFVPQLPTQPSYTQIRHLPYLKQLLSPARRLWEIKKRAAAGSASNETADCYLSNFFVLLYGT